MEANVKEILIQRIHITFLMIGLSITSVMNAEQVDLNFDMTFSASWYQKGLVPIMRVWYMIMQAFETNSEQLLFDVMLERLVFAQFCIEQVHKENYNVDNEDIAYSITIVRKIGLLLAMIKVESIMRDHIACIMSILLKIENLLESLYVPSHIETICSAEDIGIKSSSTGDLKVIKKTNSIVCL